MEAMLAEQTKVFILVSLLGAVLGLAYDVFRGFRIALGGGKIVTALFDILFCACCAVSFFASALTLQQGQIRGYAVVGCVLGALLYFSALSPLVSAVIGKIAAAASRVPACIKRVFKKIVHIAPKK